MQRNPMKFGFIAMIILASTTIAFAKMPTPGTAEWHTGFDTLRAFRHVEILSADSMEGRYTGFSGGDKAAQYIASQFAKLKLEKPFGKSGYYQFFTAGLGDYTQPAFVAIHRANRTDTLHMWRQYTIYKGSGIGSVTARVVFCGYGISAPEYGWDDYDSVDVKGAIVLVLRGTPDLPQVRWDDQATAASKMRNAAAHGALAMMTFDGDVPLSASMSGIDYQPLLPVVNIAVSFADSLLSETGTSANDWKQKLRTGKKPVSQALKASATVTVSGTWYPDRKLANVGALLRGRGKLANELIIIGGHYDHHGKDADGNVYHGANDNASGAATVLELATLFASSKTNHQRSILFIEFAAEEIWLLGSDYIAKHIPAGYKAVAMLNMDVVGSAGNAGIGGFAEFPELAHHTVEAWNDSVFTNVPMWRLYPGSDHTSFEKVAIPALVIGNATGEFSVYHTPNDTAGVVKKSGLQAVGEMCYHLAATLADVNSPLANPSHFAEAQYKLHKFSGVKFVRGDWNESPEYPLIKGVRYFSPIVFVELGTTSPSTYTAENFMTQIEQIRDNATKLNLPVICDSTKKEFKGETYRGVMFGIPFEFARTASTPVLKSLQRLGAAFVFMNAQQLADEAAIKSIAEKCASNGYQPIVIDPPSESVMKKLTMHWRKKSIVVLRDNVLDSTLARSLAASNYFVILDATGRNAAAATALTNTVRMTNSARYGLIGNSELIDAMTREGVSEYQMANLLLYNLRFALEKFNTAPGAAGGTKRGGHPY